MEVSKSNSDENYVKQILMFKKDYSYSPSGVTTPLNNSDKDAFQKVPDNSEKTVIYDKPESKWLTKENIIVGSTGLALAATAAAVGIIRGKGLSKTIKGLEGAVEEGRRLVSNLEGTVADNQKVIQGLQNAANDSQRVIEELRSKISRLTELPDDMQKAKEFLISKYRKIAGEALSYDPLTPPSKKTDDYFGWARKIFKADEISPFTRKSVSEVSDVLDTSKLRAELSSKGSVEIALPSTSKVKPVISSEASIGNRSIENLGNTVNTDFKLAYGKRTGWSEEKIARDIMQNFYDGHGNTLDGVKISVKKLPDGQFSIKIQGNATFDYENLQFMGSGTKLENPYNAGGFGEGAKVLVANLLGKGDAKAVKYSCADWTLTFDGANGIMRRTLKKVQTPIEGNSIEFTTSNKKLADAVLDSVNYFEHSKNPDFQGLHFDSKDFGFRFLEGKNKGNIYLTQRFEVEKAGNWNNGVDNLDLIFKRKPDPKRFKEITGCDLPADRDRQCLTFDDIKNYTRYFASDMSDEDLVKALMTTRSGWSNLPVDKTQTALSSFLQGIIEEIEKRSLKIDFGNTKIAAMDYSTNETVIRSLNEYGYEIFPDYFKNTGIKGASKIFDNLSVHKALAPTADEVKKLKLLEQGVQIIKDDMDIAFAKHRENPVFRFIPDVSKRNLYNSGIEGTDKEIKALFERYIKQEQSQGNKLIFGIDQISDESFAKLKQELEPLICKRLKAGADDKLVNALYEMKEIDKRTREYLSTYKSFNLIKDTDVKKPRFIFDRTKETATNTLGEAITGSGEYFGHWVDRTYLKDADFSNLLATWLHEISHKRGGDGSSEFTYALTDLVQVLVSPGSSKDTKIKLAALEEVFNSIGKTAV